MSPQRAAQPKYRHYKPKNLGVVRIAGRDHYLGDFNSPESWEKYHRLIAEWLASARQAPTGQKVPGMSGAPKQSLTPPPPATAAIRKATLP